MVTQFDDDQLKFSMITELRSGVCFSVEGNPKIGERYSMRYSAEFGCSGSNGTSVLLRRSFWKIWPIASRRSKISQGHRNLHGSIGYPFFLLTLHSNHGPSSYRFGDKRQFQSKIAKLPQPLVYLMPRGLSSSLNWVAVLGLKI